VLRELALLTRASPEFVILMIESDGGGTGILRTIADLLDDALGWHVTTENTREWLRRLSKQSGPRLVLAIDGVSATKDVVRREIEDLTSDSFGKNLRLVLSIDDAVAPRLLKNETGRRDTKIARRASAVLVDALTEEEFESVMEILLKRRIGVMQGGELAPEFRLPWVLRALTSAVVGSPSYANQTVEFSLPPLLGIDLLSAVRSRFDGNEDVRHAFQALAESALEDVSDRKRPVSTILESVERFAIRRSALRNNMERSEVTEMIDRGFLKQSINTAGEPIVVPSVPELLSSELARVLTRQLRGAFASEGPEGAANWLVDTTSKLPFGDVIGAQAFIDYALNNGDMPLSFIGHLLEKRPCAEARCASRALSTWDRHYRVDVPRGRASGPEGRCTGGDSGVGGKRQILAAYARRSRKLVDAFSPSRSAIRIHLFGGRDRPRRSWPPVGGRVLFDRAAATRHAG
jgi:hypothetical protein